VRSWVVNRSQKDHWFDRNYGLPVLNADGAGEVIAEERTEGLTPYLGYATPQAIFQFQAKQLYPLNWLRLIPDPSYTQSPWFPERNLR